MTPPLRQIVRELRDIRYRLATVDHAVSDMDRETRNDHLNRQFWPDVRENLARIRVLIPADIDTANCDVSIRSCLRDLQTIVEDFWSLYRFDETILDRSFMTDDQDRRRIDWIIKRFPPADDPQLSREPDDRVNRLFCTGRIWRAEAYFAAITASDSANPSTP